MKRLRSWISGGGGKLQGVLYRLMCSDVLHTYCLLLTCGTVAGLSRLMCCRMLEAICACASMSAMQALADCNTQEQIRV